MKMLARVIVAPFNLTYDDRRQLLALMTRRAMIDGDKVSVTAARILAGLPVSQSDYKLLRVES